MPYWDWQGHRLHYTEQGQGPLLLVLPGNTASSACHGGELAHFGRHYRCVSPDLLGTGRSDRVAVWPSDWWTQGAYQAAALIAHLGYENAIVVGTSGGAAAALLLAIHHPSMVRAVIADSTVAIMPEAKLRAEIPADRRQRLPGQVAFWRSAHGADWEQVVDADTALMARFADRGGDWFQGRLGQVRCPVLLTISKRDDMLPDGLRQNAEMVSALPRGTLYVHHQGGHPLMWSCPDVFRRVSDLFLGGIAGDP